MPRVIAALFVVTACGSRSREAEPAVDPTADPTAEVTPAPTPAPTPSAGVPVNININELAKRINVVGSADAENLRQVINELLRQKGSAQ